MKYLIVIILCLSHYVSHSQVYKFKAFESYLDKSKGDIEIDDNDWKKVDILVVINLDKKKIKIFGNKEGDYDLIMINDPIKNKNNDQVLVYHAVDEDGDECDIGITIFKGHDPDHWATMRIKYLSADMVFRLKKND